MRRRLRFALIAFALLAGQAQAQLVSDGSDGVFHAVADSTLTVDADAVFNFTEFRVDPGVIVRLGPDGYAGQVSIFANSIYIGGTLDFGAASWITLSAAGLIELTGTVGGMPTTLSLISGRGLLDLRGSPAGTLEVSNGRNLTVGGGLCLTSSCSVIPLVDGNTNPGSGQILISGGGSGSAGTVLSTIGGAGGGSTIVVAPSPVPLPAPFVLILAGLGVLAAFRKNYRR